MDGLRLFQRARDEALNATPWVSDKVLVHIAQAHVARWIQEQGEDNDPASVLKTASRALDLITYWLAA